ncbi:MAG: type II toxin-antitoxin system RelB/DinJ family antitoxin [Desulfovibrionaceae bacterium]|nr:type II toxin-antitoxin system RelB/DinJ family antitoxin [Desulfovibrionaceae bacterium]
MKNECIRARVDAGLKKDVEGILDGLGLTPSAAITLFYKQVQLHGGIPFPLRLPRPATEKAMAEAATGQNLESFDTSEALFASLKKSACASSSPASSPKATGKRTDGERTSGS